MTSRPALFPPRNAAARTAYGELLRHPKWQRRRLEALSLADFRCSKCRNGELELHVHHRRYVAGRMPWEYADADLEVLCEPCHAAEHGRPSTTARRVRHVQVVQPVDRVAWMLLLHGEWWRTMPAADREALCSWPGWHGEWFRFLARVAEAGASWDELRASLASEPWGTTAIALVESHDAAIEPVREDLPLAVAQLRVASPRRS